LFSYKGANKTRRWQPIPRYKSVIRGTPVLGRSSQGRRSPKYYLRAHSKGDDKTCGSTAIKSAPRRNSRRSGSRTNLSKTYCNDLAPLLGKVLARIPHNLLGRNEKSGCS
jgi:hypothetical protein